MLPPPDRKPTALIVDDDVGLLFWFGHILGKAGWNLLPALNCRQAVALAVMWDSCIDVVIVNPALNGVPEMIETLNRVHRPKIVLIGDSDVAATIHGDAVIDRPDVGSSFSRAQWAERVRRLLRELGVGWR